MINGRSPPFSTRICRDVSRCDCDVISPPPLKWPIVNRSESPQNFLAPISVTPPFFSAFPIFSLFSSCLLRPFQLPDFYFIFPLSSSLNFSLIYFPIIFSVVYNVMLSSILLLCSNHLLFSPLSIFLLPPLFVNRDYCFPSSVFSLLSSPLITNCLFFILFLLYSYFVFFPFLIFSHSF